MGSGSILANTHLGTRQVGQDGDALSGRAEFLRNAGGPTGRLGSCFVRLVCGPSGGLPRPKRMEMTLDTHQEKTCLLSINEPEASGLTDIDRQSFMMRSAVIGAAAAGIEV